MTLAVLDASAVIAFLKGETGEAKVAAVVADSAISVINYAEVVGHFVNLGAPLDEIRTMLNRLPITVIDANESLGWEAGALRAITRRLGLSLGDRFCLALAKRMNVPAYTADTAWKDVAREVGAKVVTIR